MKKNGNKIAVLLGLALSAALPLAAQAQTTMPGAYVGVGAGQSEPLQYDACDTRPVCKKKGTAYRFFGGYQFSRAWGVEIAYTDLGKANSSAPPTFDQSVKARLSEVTLVGTYAVTERVALFGKAGGYYARTIVDTTQSGTIQSVTQSNGNLTFGAGLQFYATPNIAVRGEGQRYARVGGGSLGNTDYTTYTVGVLFKFR
jgi:OOP family OmpA-OmpF porin